MLDGQGYDISCDLVMKVSVESQQRRPSLLTLITLVTLGL